MAFVILSTGALAGSTLHTVRVGTLAAGAAVAAAALLAGGAALGFRLAQTSLAGAEQSVAGSVFDLQPDRPEQKAVIERVGALSGRLMRLEGEALRLARSLGIAQESGGQAASAATTAGGDEPSGGPLVAPFAGPPAMAGRFTTDLERLGQEIDRVEASLTQVAEATARRDLDRMAIPSLAPVKNARISSGFGNRRDPFTRRLARHTGLDMPASYGAPILASAGGRVRFAGYRGAYGRTVEIDHGRGLVTRYGHASKLFVRTGELVLPGQKIAAVGSSGRSTGPHLHFEVLRQGRQVEPRLYLARNGT